MSKSVVARTRLCAALTGVGLLALTGCSGGSSTASLVDVADVAASPSSTASASPSATPTPEPAAVPTPTLEPTAAPTPTPVITVSEQWVEEPIGFASRRQDDPTLDQGVETVAVAGVAGVKALLTQVTLTDGVETGRAVVGEEVRVAPVDEVISVGTKAPVVVPPPPAPVAPPVIEPPAPVEAAVPGGGGCDPNYDGDCVPIDSDVDCAGGSGNGPSYVQGPVRVIGTDIYGLDGNDNDGLGCE
jgi:hypothetical protein